MANPMKIKTSSGTWVDVASATSTATADLTNYATLSQTNFSFRNKFINGDFRVWQRGTSITNVSSYSADRWETYRDGYASNLTVSRASAGLTGFQYCARVQRVAGATNVEPITFGQVLETMDSIPLAGTTVTFSFWARLGSNYSGTTSFSAKIVTGTSTDSNLRGGGLPTTLSTITPTLTTTWTRFTVSGLVSASATQVGGLVRWVPTGTAGANDYIEVTGAQLEVSATATAFEQRPLGLENSLCQRYYVDGGRIHDAYLASYPNGFNNSHIIDFPVEMRIAPTVSYSFTNVDNSYNGGTTVHNSKRFEAYWRQSNTGYSYCYFYSSYTASAEL